MTQYGQLVETDGRYEFRMDSQGLVVRGDHPEWVMLAASEILAKSARREAESRVSELEALVDFDAATPFDVDSARMAVTHRFATVPQCSVTMGRVDHTWTASGKRAVGQGHTDAAPFPKVS